ncbi:hypothetical protein [Klebsiella quasipneumoniae]|uniref:hypothetical protein n=1 Tax=Klebsiella quasipneumoniae TaxID=1463165 RepID=UPI00254B1364|nr:hypothetical protein [Klebsiella quasipneumoniae]
MRFHVVCLLLLTSGEVDPGYSPTTRIWLIWLSQVMSGVFNVIAELSAAMAAIKETAGLAKVINDAKTDAEVKAATIELQSKLITLQAECFSLGDAIRVRDEEVMYLKAKIAEFDNFIVQSEGYVLAKTEGGSFVYSKQVTVGDEGLVVHACPNCYHQKKISMLQPGIEKSFKGSFLIHFCPLCNSNFKMDKTPVSKQPVKRHIGINRFGGGGW